MTLSDRDKKLVFLLLPVALIAAYWFLLLAPKREEAASAQTQAAKQEQRAEAARAQVAQAGQAETDFASDFGEIVRLGKAVPAGVDMPSLLVQLEEAAEGTSIRFTKIATGDRTTSATAAPTVPPSTPPAGTGTTPAAAGGQQAQSAPGAAAESANNAAAASDQRNAAAEQSGVSPSDTQTSTSSGQGLPVGGGTAPGAAAPVAGGTSTVAGLETVPLDLEFTGDFFNLADFFHDVKRFVHVAGTDVVVGGRLITIEGVNYSSDPELFPKIKAEIRATVYLSPKAEGTSAGATPTGPSDTTPASTPAAVEDSAPATPAPTATATP